MRLARISSKEIAFFILTLISVAIMVFRPCEGLSGLGHMAMGFTIITVGGWIFQPFGVPNSVCGLFLLGCMVICGMPVQTAFSGFAQNALWTLIPALFFGYALQKTGLGERIAVRLLKIFPSNWPSVICAWVIIGIILSLITPSMTVRAVIMIPIGLQCCKLYDLKPGSRDASFFLLTVIFTAVFPGNAFLNGNLTASIIQGVFDTIPEMAGSLTFDSWLGGALLPVSIITILTAVLSFVILHPREKLSREKFLANIPDSSGISGKEIITAVILLAACAMFFTGRYHGISSVAVCVIAAVLLFVSGVLKGEDFNKGVNWDLVVFCGSGFCMSAIFQYSGLSDWLAASLSPLISGMAQNRYLFILLLTVFLFIWRFVDVTTLIPTMVILAPIAASLYTTLGISPVVWAALFAICSISMFLTYTNMWTFMGRKMVKEYAWKESDLFRYGLAFFIAALIGIMASVPVWMNSGLL